MTRPPSNAPSTWQLCDMLATEVEAWAGWLDSDPDGYRKVRALMHLRARDLRRAQRERRVTVHLGLSKVDLG